MFEKLEKEAQECIEKMQRESERCERTCERIFNALESLNTNSFKENETDNTCFAPNGVIFDFKTQDFKLK